MDNEDQMSDNGRNSRKSNVESDEGPPPLVKIQIERPSTATVDNILDADETNDLNPLPDYSTTVTEDEQPVPHEQKYESSFSWEEDTPVRKSIPDSDIPKAVQEQSESRGSTSSKKSQDGQNVTISDLTPSEAQQARGSTSSKDGQYVPISDTNESETQQARGSTSSQKSKDQNIPDPIDNAICPDEGCPFEKITLGEPEKDQLKLVGQHLLRIGNELLKEMNFVEGLLGKFGLTNYGYEDGSSRRTSMNGENEKDLIREIRTSVQAITMQERRLSCIQQKTEEFKEAVKLARYGSGFATPEHSISVEVIKNDKPRKSNQDTQDQDAQNKLTKMESKVEGLASKIEDCEKQITDVHSSLRGLISTVADEISQLRNQLTQNNTETASISTVVDEKLRSFEAQILKLARALWEVKCETRAQMHFGHENSN